MGARRRRFLERLPLFAHRPARAYGAAFVIYLAGFVVRWSVDGVMPSGYPYLSFFPAVILSAFLYGRGPGIMVALLSAVTAWAWFIPPRFGFALNGGVLLSLGFFGSVAAIDIALTHWLQQGNRTLRLERERSTALAEKTELLFRELQHRISNNLQVVAALLQLQKRQVTDVGARHALDEAARRLALIGRIQRELHSPDGADGSMAPFLRQLTADVLDASGRPNIASVVEADETIRLPADAAVPLALIAVECVSNALEHGFRDREDGMIRVTLARIAPDRVRLQVEDDGLGLPGVIDVANAASLGLRIASTLARQLDGSFDLSERTGGGTVATLLLPG